MRKTVVLTAANPAQTTALDFHAQTCEVQNPTGSDIYCRIGGSDFPSATNADLIVPAQTAQQFPAQSTIFAFTFANPADVGTAAFPINKATIRLLDKSEFVGTFGSFYQPPRPSYYDARNHPLTIARYYNSGSGLSPHAQTTRWEYIVPANRQAFVETVYLFLQRYSVATGGWSAAAVFLYYTPFGQGPVMLQSAQESGNLPWQVVQPIVSQLGVMSAGDRLSMATGDGSIGGLVGYIGSMKAFEFDA